MANEAGSGEMMSDSPRRVNELIRRFEDLICVNKLNRSASSSDNFLAVGGASSLTPSLLLSPASSLSPSSSVALHTRCAAVASPLSIDTTENSAGFVASPQSAPISRDGVGDGGVRKQTPQNRLAKATLTTAMALVSSKLSQQEPKQLPVKLTNRRLLSTNEADQSSPEDPNQLSDIDYIDDSSESMSHASSATVATCCTKTLVEAARVAGDQQPPPPPQPDQPTTYRNQLDNVVLNSGVSGSATKKPSVPIKPTLRVVQKQQQQEQQQQQKQQPRQKNGATLDKQAMPDKYKNALNEIVERNRVTSFEESQHFQRIQEVHAATTTSVNTLVDDDVFDENNNNPAATDAGSSLAEKEVKERLLALPSTASGQLELMSQRLFVDENFRACDESLFFSETFRSKLNAVLETDQLVSTSQQDNASLPPSQIRWVRARQHFANATFSSQASLSQIGYSNYKNYFKTDNVVQGHLDNGWFVSAASEIAENNYELLKRIIPFDNSFENLKYTGAFHFCFWIYGSWQDVIVDDYLPVDAQGRLIFGHNVNEPHVLWFALLEKAYAKLHGSYEALNGGFTNEALINLSGGIDEVFDLKKIVAELGASGGADGDADCLHDNPTLNRHSFWRTLMASKKKGSIIGCMIKGSSDASTQEGSDEPTAYVALSNGLFRSLTYLVNDVAEVRLLAAPGGTTNGAGLQSTTLHKLVRLSTQSDSSVEWTGDWSHNSPIWNQVDENTRRLLKYNPTDTNRGGKFWMAYSDYLANFDFCEIFNLTPYSVCHIDGKESYLLSDVKDIFSMWQCEMHHGAWVKGKTAGGCGLNNEDSYWSNPRITFTLEPEDVLSDGWCEIIVDLIQKHSRRKRQFNNGLPAEKKIGFGLYKSLSTNLSSNDYELTDLEFVGSTQGYSSENEVTERFLLRAGVYVVVPACFEPDVEAEFFLRIFTEKPLSKKSSVSCSRRPTLHSKQKIQCKKEAAKKSTTRNKAAEASSYSSGATQKDAASHFAVRRAERHHSKFKCNPM